MTTPHGFAEVHRALRRLPDETTEWLITARCGACGAKAALILDPKAMTEGATFLPAMLQRLDFEGGECPAVGTGAVSEQTEI